MPTDRTEAPETFLSRWSRRKLAAAREASPAASAPVAPAPPAPEVAAPTPTAAGGALTPPPAQNDLPPLDTLTFDSDFTAFLRPGVDPSLQRAALRTLLRDPRFNVMDGLDTYIDDYTKPSPLDPAVARTLAHAQALFAPRRTRVNAEGVVEDVPEAEEPPAAVVAVPLPDAEVRGATAPPVAPSAPLDEPAATRDAVPSPVDPRPAQS